MWRTHRGVRWVLGFITIAVTSSILWPIIVYFGINDWVLGGQGCTNKLFAFSIQWNPESMTTCDNFVTSNYATLFFVLRFVVNNMTFPYAAQLVICSLLVAGIQSLQTIGLHCVELLVNLSRDEAAWHRATDNKLGAHLSSQPFVSAILSWENIVLFIAKAMLHWLMGQSMSVGSSEGLLLMIMIYSRLLWYAVLSVLVAIFAARLAFKKARSPQPAAFGHIQTLANLIDDWKTDEKGRFWWGEKTGLLAGENQNRQVRHAGTSWEKDRLSFIRLDEKYAAGRFCLGSSAQSSCR